MNMSPPAIRVRRPLTACVIGRNGEMIWNMLGAVCTGYVPPAEAIWTMSRTERDQSAHTPQGRNTELMNYVELGCHENREQQGPDRGSGGEVEGEGEHSVEHAHLCDSEQEAGYVAGPGDAGADFAEDISARYGIALMTM